MWNENHTCNNIGINEVLNCILTLLLLASMVVSWIPNCGTICKTEMLAQSFTFSVWHLPCWSLCMVWSQGFWKTSTIATTLDQSQRRAKGREERRREKERDRMGKRAKSNDCSHLPGTSEGSLAELSVRSLLVTKMQTPIGFQNHLVPRHAQRGCASALTGPFSYIFIPILL